MNNGGESPRVRFVLKQGTRIDEGELREFARANLAHFRASHSVPSSKSYAKLRPERFKNTFWKHNVLRSLRSKSIQNVKWLDATPVCRQYDHNVMHGVIPDASEIAAIRSHDDPLPLRQSCPHKVDIRSTRAATTSTRKTTARPNE